MRIEIRAVGGYNEIGRNMTAVRVGDEVIILDMGLHIENYISLTEEEDIVNLSTSELIDAKAVPDISVIDDWKAKIKAIIPTHAHLDHVGAIPYLAKKFKAPILCTPFTAEVIKAILKDEKIKMGNHIKPLNSNSVYHVSDNIKIEFINMTHSTPQTVMVALHTKNGCLLYANDFKFDNFPILGKKPNFNKLRELSNSCQCLIVECLRAKEAIKTPSESVAKAMLKDVLLGTESNGKAIIATTFSSHLERLKSIIEFGKQMNRKVVFLGRSLSKYVVAGERAGIVNFTKDVELAKRGRHIKRILKDVEVNRKKYLVVVTGHQGEQKAVLSRMATGELPFRFKEEDHMIFASSVIPNPSNISDRKRLEENFRGKNLRIFKDIHVSGHAAREDLRDLINIVNPKNIIPAHGDTSMNNALKALALEIGGSNILLIKESDNIAL